MIAVILVGGFGTRLRPLTYTRPKQLLPLGNTTLIEYMIGRLAEQEFREIVLAVGYRPDTLKEVLGDGERLGVNIHYSLEEEPLGTAGPIRQAEDYLRGSGEFFVLNGDIVSDMNYQQILVHHRYHQAQASIALYRVDDPSRYGVVDITSEGQILAFIEKPPADTAPSNLINAGCYVLDESVLDHIPLGRKVSIERETFPLLCEKGRVYGWEHKGLWIDTGTPSSYLEANKEVLAASTNQSHRESPPTHHGPVRRMYIGPTSSRNVRYLRPYWKGKDTIIGNDCEIGPNVTLGRNVTIGAGTRIRDAVIFNCVEIGESVVLRNTVIGQGAKIGDKIRLEEFQLVGDGATIYPGAIVPPGARIDPGTDFR